MAEGAPWWDSHPDSRACVTVAVSLLSRATALENRVPRSTMCRRRPKGGTKARSTATVSLNGRELGMSTSGRGGRGPSRRQASQAVVAAVKARKISASVTPWSRSKPIRRVAEQCPYWVWSFRTARSKPAESLSRTAARTATSATARTGAGSEAPRTRPWPETALNVRCPAAERARKTVTSSADMVNRPAATSNTAPSEAGERRLRSRGREPATTHTDTRQRAPATRTGNSSRSTARWEAPPPKVKTASPRVERTRARSTGEISARYAATQAAPATVAVAPMSRMTSPAGPARDGAAPPVATRTRWHVSLTAYAASSPSPPPPPPSPMPPPAPDEAPPPPGGAPLRAASSARRFRQSRWTWPVMPPCQHPT